MNDPQTIARAIRDGTLAFLYPHEPDEAGYLQAIRHDLEQWQALHESDRIREQEEVHVVGHTGFMGDCPDEGCKAYMRRAFPVG